MKKRPGKANEMKQVLLTKQLYIKPDGVQECRRNVNWWEGEMRERDVGFFKISRPFWSFPRRRDRVNM